MRISYALVVFGAVCLGTTPASAGSEDLMDEVHELTDYIVEHILMPVDQEKCRPLYHNMIVAASPRFSEDYWTPYEAVIALREEKCLDEYFFLKVQEPAPPNPLMSYYLWDIFERLFVDPEELFHDERLEPTIHREVPVQAEMPTPRLRPPHGRAMPYLEGKYAYLRIDNFLSDKAWVYFEQDIAHMHLYPPEGIILDLRGNRGGWVEFACYVLEKFAREATVAVTHKTQTKTSPLCEVSGPGLLTAIPVVVLVDGQTASASEMVVSTLKRWYPDTVTVVGTRTFAKGVIQYKLSEWEDSLGLTLHLTYAEYFPGPDTTIRVDGVGVTPDIWDLQGKEELAFAASLLEQATRPVLLEYPPVAMGP